MLQEDEFIALARVEYHKLKALKEIDNYYDYEKTFDEIWTTFGRITLEQVISKTPNDRRKKKLKSLRRNRNSQYTSL